MTETTGQAPIRDRADRSGWWNGARFGMFIHWGPYSVAGRGEWVMNRERISVAEYDRQYATAWKAERFDPAVWTRLASESGMKYMVMTARHHDGFALWDTATTPRNAVRVGPGRDLVRPFADVVRAAGLRLGLYLSAADWTHPDYPAAFARDWPQPADWRDEASRGRFAAFYRAQLREILGLYGKVDLLWWDGCIPAGMEGRAANEDARRLQPDILITERNGEPWDIAVSEQAIKARQGIPWEACMTLNDSWGYHAGDRNWKTARDVIEMLFTTVAGGGNLLLNVGPRGDGTIPEESAAILREVGAWLRRHEGILDEAAGRASPFTWNNTVAVSLGRDKVFLRFRHQPGAEFCWAELRNPVEAVRFHGTGQPIRFRQEGPRLFLEGLPSPLPDPVCTVAEVLTRGAPEPLTGQTTFWIPGN